MNKSCEEMAKLLCVLDAPQRTHPGDTDPIYMQQLWVAARETRISKEPIRYVDSGAGSGLVVVVVEYY